MRTHSHWLTTELEHRGVSRREFMGFCATMAAALALPDAAAAQIARAIQKTEKPVLLWLEFQDCAGNTESFLRASRPSAAGNHSRHPVARLSRDDHGGGRPQAEAESRQTREGARRRVHRRHRRIDSRRAPTARTARSAAARPSTSPARCARTRPRRSPSARAPPSAAFRRRRPIRPARWASPTRCPASRI